MVDIVRLCIIEEIGFIGSIFQDNVYTLHTLYTLFITLEYNTIGRINTKHNTRYNNSQYVNLLLLISNIHS